MSRLDSAEKRVHDAISRLEAAVETRAGATEEDVAGIVTPLDECEHRRQLSMGYGNGRKSSCWSWWIWA